MVQNDNLRRKRKTSILGVNNLPNDTRMHQVAKSFESFDVVTIKRKNARNESEFNYLIEFGSSEECENAFTEVQTILIKDTKYPVFYASSDSLSEARKVVSENKLYVKCPRGVDKQDVMKMFNECDIYDPNQTSSYFFVNVESQEKQIDLQQKYKDLQVDGKNVIVSFAINSVKNNRIRSRKIE
ncbi:Y9E7 [Hepatospora eriocheir]|uniref:Y9E7 n=2 Tax=Hepatospora eriocheir TaxID=1081669 RepID=A0A1X0Q9G3_9MICR|nr:Y9E7 [Hepatospora eriocheir]